MQESISFTGLIFVIISLIPSLLSAANLGLWMYLWTRVGSDDRKGMRGTYIITSVMFNLCVTVFDHISMIGGAAGYLSGQPIYGTLVIVGVILSLIPLIHSSIVLRSLSNKILNNQKFVLVWDHRGNGGEDIKSSLSIGNWDLIYFTGVDSVQAAISASNTKRPQMIVLYDNGTLGVKSIKSLIGSSKGSVKAAVVITSKENPYHATLLSYGLRSVVFIDRDYGDKYDIMDVVQEVFQSIAVGADLGAVVSAASINKPTGLITLKGDSTWRLIEMNQAA